MNNVPIFLPIKMYMTDHCSWEQFLNGFLQILFALGVPIKNNNYKKNRKKEIQFSCCRNLFSAFPVLLQIQDLSVIGQVAHSKLITLCSRTSKCCKLWSCSFDTISFERRNEWMKFHFPPRILVINSKNTSGEI